MQSMWFPLQKQCPTAATYSSLSNKGVAKNKIYVMPPLPPIWWVNQDMSEVQKSTLLL